MQLLRHLLGQIVRLTPVFVGVVELPNVVVERRGYLAYKNPWRFMSCDRGPALVVNTAVAEHLEVLRLVLLCSLCVVERISHADALDGMLLDAIDEDRLGQAGHLKDGWRNVDQVV